MVDSVTYDPNRYQVTSFGEAASIILTPEESSTEKRWNAETPVLSGLITEHCSIKEESLILDYGCGVGRLGKSLILQHGCRVVGADTSATMRAYCNTWVLNPKFLACDPLTLKWMGFEGKFDVAICVWVLQHCLDVDEILKTISEQLYPGGLFFVVNGDTRAIPVLEDPFWWDDGVSISELLDDKFHSVIKPSRHEVLPGGSWWGVWQNYF